MPRRIDKLARRARLVDAARAVVLREGAHALSIAKVAREAGLAKATVFESYGTRDQLLDAAYSIPLDSPPDLQREGLDGLLSWMRARVLSPDVRMQALVRVEAARPSCSRARALRERMEEQEQMLAVALRDAMERGRIRSIPPTRLAGLLLASADGVGAHLTALALTGDDREVRVLDFLGVWRAQLGS